MKPLQEFCINLDVEKNLHLGVGSNAKNSAQDGQNQFNFQRRVAKVLHSNKRNIIANQYLETDTFLA